MTEKMFVQEIVRSECYQRKARQVFYEYGLVLFLPHVGGCVSACSLHVTFASVLLCHRATVFPPGLPHCSLPSERSHVDLALDLAGRVLPCKKAILFETARDGERHNYQTLVATSYSVTLGNVLPLIIHFYSNKANPSKFTVHILLNTKYINNEWF